MGISGISTDVSALFGASAKPAASGSPSEEQAPVQEVTTVRTQCDKKHWHTRACAHTVSTVSVDPTRGNIIDTYA